MWILSYLLLFYVTIWATSGESLAANTQMSQVDYNITCSPTLMIVSVMVNSTSSEIYLDGLKMYPGCQPDRSEGNVVFKLPLDNIYECGTTKMLNKYTNVKIYYHRIIIEEPQKEKQIILVTCNIPPSHNTTSPPIFRRRRDILPENFVEPEYINITDYIVASAPIPYLNLVLRQKGKVLDTALNVQPGTPLEMLIYLDKESAATYGLLASYLKVTDSSPYQEEVIIMNGCSIDPYIFGNFQSLENGDALTAKFRAFKFPEASYVLFVGTVSVCLQQCRGIPCGNGQTGFGRRRRRRAVPTDLPPDPNKIFEVEMTTFLQVQYSADHFKLNKGSIESGLENKETNTDAANQVAAYVQNSAYVSTYSTLALQITTSITVLLSLVYRANIDR